MTAPDPQAIRDALDALGSTTEDDDCICEPKPTVGQWHSPACVFRKAKLLANDKGGAS